ncbi:hypothetical protein TTHERM_000794031 (macronuclear) [Tetrahymena thermophila SB210]|uniref:Transmembrane protein n=1 Tax=Tetrahymena thermophila (strain SB210) TaxID=312017 RepID=W7X9T8_TETTS|nr:hypothetical protein TTHERM_000794031 [Tetrahymena thermophila SB210]EWS73168.1 hypothetical protein TTHERM_000794031 [Tetrahymena thermophila SB210]|eukprot:XP_012654288.1 hypothetical protein TTHERM_000794031 [Tetrahymena thermophila SB210]
MVFFTILLIIQLVNYQYHIHYKRSKLKTQLSFNSDCLFANQLAFSKKFSFIKLNLIRLSFITLQELNLFDLRSVLLIKQLKNTYLIVANIQVFLQSLFNQLYTLNNYQTNFVSFLEQADRLMKNLQEINLVDRNSKLSLRLKRLTK